MGSDGKSSESMLSRRDQLEQLTQDRFGNLLTTKGFLEAPTERTVISTHFYFTREDRGLDITLEYREKRVELYLLRLIGGNVPKHGYIENGEVVCIPLMRCLHDFLHFDDERISDLRAILQIDVLDFDSAAAAVCAWGDVVEHHLEFLTVQSLSTLFPSTEVFYQIMMPKSS